MRPDRIQPNLNKLYSEKKYIKRKADAFKKRLSVINKTIHKLESEVGNEL